MLYSLAVEWSWRESVDDPSGKEHDEQGNEVVDSLRHPEEGCIIDEIHCTTAEGSVKGRANRIEEAFEVVGLWAKLEHCGFGGPQDLAQYRKKRSGCERQSRDRVLISLEGIIEADGQWTRGRGMR